MHSRPVGSAPPPFYWKVPVPEKDYMSENYRRIRQIANQSQKKRNEPLKAAFIPGVTKNEKYAHVSSRVGEFLKSRKGPDAASKAVPTPSNPRFTQPQSAAPVSRRLSKSSTDLRPNNANHSNSGAKNATSSHSHASAPIRRRRGSQESFHQSQESVYNWHFKDDVNAVPPGANYSNGFHNSVLPAKYCHRVEYLPCDGICAEENFVIDDCPPESARSASSCRTSRGCNTEETRILDDPVKCFELDKQIDSTGDVGESVVDACGELLSKSQLGSKPKSRSVHTMASHENFEKRNDNVQWLKTTSTSNSESNVLNFTGARGKLNSQSDVGRIKTSVSCTSLSNGRQPQVNGVGGAGDFPHTPGTVPKYLKQRQEEWKIQEKERKESEMNANVPQGYVLLSDNERMEHLKSFKRNYDTLINELNRIPIRIDTIRVREHKIQLEQQLTRLEEAMKTFSRPRVWIKVDD